MNISRPSQSSVARVVVVLLVTALLLLLSGALAAAELSGHLDIGVRDVDHSGTDYKYDQHVNLDSGARVFGLAVDYAAVAAEDIAPETISVRASGLGGDPYEWLQVRARNSKHWDFRYQRRESVYLYEDLLRDPADFNVESSNGGDFHQFDLERRRESAELDVRVNEQLTFGVDFRRQENTGTATTVLDISREEFLLETRVDDSSDEIELSVDYKWDKTQLSFSETWRDVDSAREVFLPGASEGMEPEAGASLDRFTFAQPYGYDSREHHLSVISRPLQRLQVHADVLLVALDMDVSTDERTQGNDFLERPLQTTEVTQGDADKDILQLYLSSAWAFNDQLRATLTVRDQQIEQDGEISVVTVDELSPTPVDAGERAFSRWDIDRTQVRLGLEWVRGAYSAAGGVGREWRKVNSVAEGLVDAPSDRVKTDRTGLWLRLGWRPNKYVAVNASLDDSSIDDPYALASATDTRRYRVRAKLRHDSGLTLNASWLRRERKNTLSGYDSTTDHSAVRLGWARPDLSVFVGASFVTLDHEIEQLVRGGFRTDLFLIDYSSDADFLDASVRWQAVDDVELFASYRDYSNSGSVAVDREDLRLGVDYRISSRYSANLTYRDIDYAEAPDEDFAAEIWELALRINW